MIKSADTPEVEIGAHAQKYAAAFELLPALAPLLSVVDIVTAAPYGASSRSAAGDNTDRPAITDRETWRRGFTFVAWPLAEPEKVADELKRLRG